MDRVVERKIIHRPQGYVNAFEYLKLEDWKDPTQIWQQYTNLIWLLERYRLASGDRYLQVRYRNRHFYRCFINITPSWGQRRSWIQEDVEGQEPPLENNHSKHRKFQCLLGLGGTLLGWSYLTIFFNQVTRKRLLRSK